MNKDKYKETRIIEFPGMIVKVHTPDITAEERERRMKEIRRTAAEVIRASG